MVAPWINISRMWVELNFTEEQRTPLTQLLQQHPNSSFAAVTYACNTTTLNCTVSCMLGDGSNGSSAENGSSLCTDGYRLEYLTNSTRWMHLRWGKLCAKFMTLQIMEPNLAWLKLVGNDTVVCEFNTSVPIRYNITMYGHNLTRVDKQCTQNENQTVMCSISNSTLDIHNMSVLNCTIHRAPWPVWIVAHFNRSEDDMEEYYYYEDEYEDYFEYDDDGYDVLIEYREGEEDYEEYEEEEEEEEETQRVTGEGTVELPKHAKHVGGPPKKKPPPKRHGGPVLIVGIVAVATVGILAVLLRKKMKRSPHKTIY